VRGFNGASATKLLSIGEISSFDAILTRSASYSASIFPHYVAAMNLHGDFADPQLKGDCLLSLPETTRPITSRSRALRAS